MCRQKDNRKKFGEDAFRTVMRNFYVDDLLKSKETEEKAAMLALAVEGICKAGGFNLTKFISPSLKLLQQFPAEKRVKFVEDISIAQVETRALGVEWCIEKDTLKFRVHLKDKSLTRRGMLSSLSSAYDPDGIGGPFLLQGHKILQEVTSLKGDWDDQVPEQCVPKWEKWRRELLL